MSVTNVTNVTSVTDVTNVITVTRDGRVNFGPILLGDGRLSVLYSRICRGKQL